MPWTIEYCKELFVTRFDHPRKAAADVRLPFRPGHHA
jgi:hypothetical protein